MEWELKLQFQPQITLQIDYIQIIRASPAQLVESEIAQTSKQTIIKLHIENKLIFHLSHNFQVYHFTVPCDLLIDILLRFLLQTIL